MMADFRVRDFLKSRGGKKIAVLSIPWLLLKTEDELKLACRQPGIQRKGNRTIRYGFLSSNIFGGARLFSEVQ